MSDVATLLILSLEHRMQTRQATGDGRREVEWTPAGLDRCLSIPACLGDAGWKKAPEGMELAQGRLLSGSRNVPPALAALDEAVASPECCQHTGRKLHGDLLPQHSPLGLEGLVETFPVRQRMLRGPEGPKAALPSPLQALQACFIPSRCLARPKIPVPLEIWH